MNTPRYKQVLYYSPTTWSNTDFYRTTGVLPFINHPELIFRDISHYGQLNQWDLKGADILIIQRPGTPNGLNLIKMAKSMGIKVIIDFDDDVLNVDFYNPTFVQYQQQREIILECIALADEVWCSTEAIKQSFGKGVVIKNALNIKLLGEFAEYNTGSNNIVFRGGSSHQADIYENPDRIVEMVNGHPEFTFYFIGDRFTYLEMRCGDNFNSVEGMPIMQYFQYLKQLKPKALMFPLRDTPLNRGKSNICWLESAWAGAAFFGNTNLPEFNISGTLPIEQMEYLLSHGDVLKNAYDSSRNIIEESITLDKINELRVTSLLNL